MNTILGTKNRSNTEKRAWSFRGIFPPHTTTICDIQVIKTFHQIRNKVLRAVLACLYRSHEHRSQLLVLPPLWRWKHYNIHIKTKISKRGRDYLGSSIMTILSKLTTKILADVHFQIKILHLICYVLKSTLLLINRTKTPSCLC